MLDGEKKMPLSNNFDKPIYTNVEEGFRLPKIRQRLFLTITIFKKGVQFGTSK